MIAFILIKLSESMKGWYRCPPDSPFHVCPHGQFVFARDGKLTRWTIFFLLKIITRRMPFQVLHLYQLKIFGSFAENACSEVNLLASEASIIIMIQVRSYKGLCDEQKIMIEPGVVAHVCSPGALGG